MNTQFLNTQVQHTHSLKFFRPKSLLIFLALAAGIPALGLAGPLSLSNNALEVVTGVEPNIMMLNDDSGSMDFSIMSNESNGFLHMPGDVTWPYAYAHPAPGATSYQPARNGYYHDYDSPYLESSSVLPTEEYLASIGVTAPYQGVWRGWNADYNKIYYNPNITYEPWVGLDNSGTTAFADASSTAARYNPYDSSAGTLNLTTDLSDYYTACPLTFTECAATGVFVKKIQYYDYDASSYVDIANLVLADGFYPARYYVWTDTNADDIVDAGDAHSLIEIKSTTASYGGREAYSESSGTGRKDCKDNTDPTICTYTQEIQNFANWFSYYRKRDLVSKAAMAAAIKPAESARIGYATINSRYINLNKAALGLTSTFNIKVASMNVSTDSGNKKTLLDNIFSTIPFGPTPLRQALVDTGEYFECHAKDIFDSAGGTDCPIEAAPAGQCQQNYTILMTDGYWDNFFGDTADVGADFIAQSASPPRCSDEPFGCFYGGTAVGNTDEDGTYDFDGGAFADTESNTLADVAMHYYERDLAAGLDDDVPTTLNDINRYRGATDPFETMHQHMATYTVGFGVKTSLTAGPTDKDATFAWTTPVPGTITTVDDLAHAAINSRGDYYDATNPVELVTKMESIFNAIETQTGTATAVAFNTQEVEAGTLVFRASFNTKTNKGDLVAQRVYANGTVNSTILWSAADQLDNKTGSTGDSRVIVSYQDTGTSSSAGVAFKWSDLNTGQKALLDTPAPAVGEERLGYLRGQSENEGTTASVGNFRTRAAREGKLGDIVHSTPVFVGKPSFLGRTSAPYPVTVGETYAEFKIAQAGRTQLTYVGANDGMLHAFDTTDGSEHFAYIPNILIGDLPELTDPAYSHRYYVDLRPAVNDVYIMPSSGSTTNPGDLSWNTVLVGGLAGGGKGYFALNITKPGDLDSESEVAGNVMWEFTEADDGGVGSSDLGFSFSEPLIAMTNQDDSSGNKVWVAIFGNGYNSTSASGDAALYILKLEGGQNGVWDLGTNVDTKDFMKISTGFGKAESADTTTPNGISGIRGIDTDGNGTVDYVYAGDLQGNLIRFDLTNSSSSSWGSTKLLFQARYGAAGTRDDTSATSASRPQPITSRPIVIKHPDKPGYIVITATGSWMTTGDATNEDIQSMYGIWDDMSNGSATVPDITMISGDNQLVEQEFTNYSSPLYGFTVRSLSNNTVTWKNTGLADGKVKGWYIDLDVPPAGSTTGVEYPGERAVRNLQIRGGLLFVNTIIPKATNACAVGSGGFELAFNPVTGGSGETIIFDLNNDSSFDDDDNIDPDGTNKIVTGIRFDKDTPTDSAFIGSRRMTQEGDDIRSFDTNTGNDPLTGRTSWREIVE